ncbi:MAG: hypothetical protein ABIB46_00625 [bacterium]
MKTNFILGLILFLFINFSQAADKLDNFDTGINSQWKYWDGTGDFDYTPLANDTINAEIQTPGANGTNQALKLNLSGQNNRMSFYWIDNDTLKDEFDPANTLNGGIYISESNGAKYLNLYINYPESILQTDVATMGIGLVIGKKYEHGVGIEVKTSGTTTTVTAKNPNDADYQKDSPHYRRQTTYSCTLGQLGVPGNVVSYILPAAGQWQLVSIPLTNGMSFKMRDRSNLIGSSPYLSDVAKFDISQLGQQIDDPLKLGDKFTLLVTEFCIGFADAVKGTVLIDEVNFSITSPTSIENKSWGAIKEMFK